MNLDALLEHEPPKHTRVEPDPHRLIVYDHPDDGMCIEHPPSCVREYFTWPSGDPGVVYRCVVQWHLDAVGVDYVYRHAFDDPHPGDWREPLLPGTYTFRYAVTFWAYRSMWDDNDPDEDIDVLPQAAIDTGYYVPFKCAVRSPWSRQEWEQAYDRYTPIIGQDGAWKALVHLCEMTSTHPYAAGEALVTAMREYQYDGEEWID